MYECLPCSLYYDVRATTASKHFRVPRRQRSRMFDEGEEKNENSTARMYARRAVVGHLKFELGRVNSVLKNRGAVEERLVRVPKR